MGDGRKIRLEEPLNDEALSAVIADFDGANINSREGHWWGTNTEEDKPSHKRNMSVAEDGGIKLGGVDFTEGRIRTSLIISGDRRVIEVDREWNASRVRALLQQQGVRFEIEKDWWEK